MTYFFLHVILNDSEESHRRTDRHILFTSVVGYFAFAQYDVLFLVVIAREAKRRSKLPGGWVSAGYILFTSVVGYFAFAQYDVKKTIVGVADDSGMQIQRFWLVAKALYKFYLYIARRGGRD